MKEPLTEGRLIDENTGLLTWAATDRAIAKFTDMADVKSKEEALVETLGKWLAST